MINKLLYVGKTPFTKGGEAIKMFWMLKEFSKNCEIHIIDISNFIESKYFIDNKEIYNDLFPNVIFHSLSNSKYTIIDNSLFNDILIDKILNICNEYNINKILYAYSFPFININFIVKSINNIDSYLIPAGSDVKLLENNKFSQINLMLNKFNKIFILESNKYFFQNLNNIEFIKFSISNEFVDLDETYKYTKYNLKNKIISFGNLSKSNGINVIEELSNEFEILLFGNNNINKKNIICEKYIQHQYIPYILKNSGIILIPETEDFNINGHLNRIIYETIMCGGTLIISNHMYNQLNDFMKQYCFTYKSLEELKELIYLYINNNEYKQQLIENSYSFLSNFKNDTKQIYDLIFI